MTPVAATVLWGANNIFTLRAEDGTIADHVRLKGKVLDGEEEAHNPLAPGDRVTIIRSDTGTYSITGRVPRINAVSRWNRKRGRLQTIAANVDRLYVVTSLADPAYRSGFVDRVLVMAELEEIDCAVVVNKADLPGTILAEEHLTTLRGLGYTVFMTVANCDSPVGIDTLRIDHPGGTIALFGQSGVGKSSLINLLIPGSDQQTGSVSHRYNRGRHTTTLARQIIATAPTGGGPGTVYIDTPGIREYALDQYAPTEVAAGFREFRRFIPECRMPSCTHLHEPGCAVRQAVEGAVIAAERYESYRRIVAELRDVPV